jgi:divalent metal cation (Fe/Co/Zn/Cd) transporter
VLANETRSLIAGEAVAGPIMEELHRVLAADSRILQIDEIATMHLGPQVILMALTLRFRSELSIPALDDAIREITSTLQSAEKRVAYVYVRPRPNGGALAEANPPNIRDIAFRAD